MNVSDIKTRVKRQFGDESAVQIQDADIYRWITDGQKAIVIQNENVLQTSVTTLSVAGQMAYTMPADIVHLNSVTYKSITLKKMTLQEFELYMDGWEDSTLYSPGIPTCYHPYASTFVLFPAPQLSNESIKIFYSKLPASVTSDGDALSLPLQYHEAIVTYCLQQAHQLDENEASSNARGVELQNTINSLRDRETYAEDQFYPCITTRVEDL